jgi:CRP-like cAMP-binding protein
MRKVLFIFGELTDGDVEWLAKAGERIQLDPGSVLIAAGSRVDHLYIVLDGQVAIKSAAGKEFARLESGEILGEMSLVDPAPAMVTVEAATRTLVLRIPDSKLREKLSQDFPFAARFYRAICVFLADRVRASTQRLGYGENVAAAEAARGELNENVLENLHLAGARFDRMLKKLAG